MVPNSIGDDWLAEWNRHMAKPWIPSPYAIARARRRSTRFHPSCTVAQAEVEPFLKIPKNGVKRPALVG
jgi:hypothetical protein